jgi:hypothetical protein
MVRVLAAFPTVPNLIACGMVLSGTVCFQGNPARSGACTYGAIRLCLSTPKHNLLFATRISRICAVIRGLVQPYHREFAGNADQTRRHALQRVGWHSPDALTAH